MTREEALLKAQQQLEEAQSGMFYVKRENVPEVRTEIARAYIRLAEALGRDYDGRR